MSNRRLLVFCEGNDDADFIDTVVRPELSGVYAQNIRTVRIAEKPNEKVRDYARNAARSGADVLLLYDKDDAPSVRARIDFLLDRYDRAIPEDRVFIVVIEIESWYAAGLDRQTSEDLLGRPLQRTDDLTKERFNALRPEGEPRASFLRLLLENYSIERARTKNHSFDYFCTRMLDPPFHEDDIFAGEAE